MKKQELLAPAGDIEAGYAALYYGADAIYLGLSKFSARATATNFDETDLDEFTAYAHHLNRKVYVAINTVLQESELPDLIESLDICTRCHVDGIIIQDLGVANVIKEQYPWFEMHASTQMAVHNKEGALFLQKMGFKRVVLARELTLAEIKEIASIPNLETEAFIHGALCYSYSGLCQFSAIETGRSANRGKCTYPCRARFACNGRESNIFSMKDMALQEDVLKMPVDSLKIEGRKKSALYVAAVTDYYRQILDGKGADSYREEHIKQIFSRPWCKFHFAGKDKNVIDRNFVGHRGLFIGQIEKITRNKLIFKTNHKIARFDGLQIDAAGDDKPFGFSVQKLSVNHQNRFEAQAGDTVEIDLPPNYPHLKTGDKIYLASSSEVKGAYHYEKPKANLYRNTNDISVEVKVEKNIITAGCNQFEAQIIGDFTPTDNPQKSTEAIQKAFAKTGDTKFNLKELHIENKENLFTPASLLNELRRQLYAQIQIEQPKGKLPQISTMQNTQKTRQFKIKVDNLDSLRLLNLDNFAEIIYLLSPQSNIDEIAKLPKNKVRLALPAVCRHPILFTDLIDKLLSMGYSKWQVANYWALQILPLERLDISFDSSLYMLNTQAISMAQKMGVSSITLSLEDIKSNICYLIKKSQLATDLIIYTDIPLFISVGCIRDNDCKVCPRCEMWSELSLNGKTYKALSRDCQMMVFDNQPFCIATEAADLEPNSFRMDFLYRPYTAEKVLEISNKLLKFENLSDCIKSNFLTNNI
jgi:putative protease